MTFCKVLLKLSDVMGVPPDRTGPRPRISVRQLEVAHTQHCTWSDTGIPPCFTTYPDLYARRVMRKTDPPVY